MMRNMGFLYKGKGVLISRVKVYENTVKGEILIEKNIITFFGTIYNQRLHIDKTSGIKPPFGLLRMVEKNYNNNYIKKER